MMTLYQYALEAVTSNQAIGLQEEVWKVLCIFHKWIPKDKMVKVKYVSSFAAHSFSVGEQWKVESIEINRNIFSGE